MKFIRIALIVLFVLFGIYLILCITGPKDMNLTRSVSVGQSPQLVYEEVSDFQKWPSWSPWAGRDTAMKNTFSGNPGEVGHKNEWESATEGSGTQEIIDIRPGEFIRTELRFKDWDGSSFSNWTFEPTGDSTLVTWTMDGEDIPFFFRGLMRIFGAKAKLEQDYDKGLANLKAVAEAKPGQEGLVYTIVDIPDMWYLGKRMKLNMKDADSSLFANTYAELTIAIGGPDKMAGMPFSIGHEVNMETGDMDLEIALPVAAEMKAPQGLTSGKVPAGKCLKYEYKGPYENTGPAWGQLMGEASTKFKTRWAGFEIYANDPATVASKDELITWLMQPVE